MCKTFAAAVYIKTLKYDDEKIKKEKNWEKRKIYKWHTFKEYYHMVSVETRFMQTNIFWKKNYAEVDVFKCLQDKERKM